MNNEKKDNSSENGNDKVIADKQKLENKVKEIQNNIRHIIQLAVSWFVFFVTVNYATMGWLATGSVSIHRGIIAVIAVAFIVQNIIGMVALRMTETEVKKMSAPVKCYEGLSIDEDNKLCKEIREVESIPIELLTNLKKCMSGVLVLLVVAWIIYAVIRICNT